MLNPNDRVVMVSGANRGIGLAIAKTLATAGYQLSLGARNPDSIDTAAIGDDVMTHRWEAQDATTSSEWVRATVTKFGRLDAVVMNAGVIFPADIETGSEEEMDTMWEVNFKGPLRLIRAALPALREAGHGRVVNIVSLSGIRLMAESSLGYSASKFAAMALTHAIRQNGWDAGIRATAICPGLVETDMVAHVKTPDGEFKIDAQTIADTTAYALSLPDSASVAEIKVNSRLEAMF